MERRLTVNESSDRQTYGGLSDSAFAKFVEVDEELANTDAVLGDACLNALFNIILVVEGSCLTLIVALMTMSCSAHVLHVVAD